MSKIVRYTHSNASNKLRYTVAYSFEKSESGELEIHYGVAQCRKGDTFSRAAGRELAEARLNKAFSGKTAPLQDSLGQAVTPLYGKLYVLDQPGVNVRKHVAETFESDRSKALAFNSKNSLIAVAEQLFGRGLAQALGL